MRKYKEKIDELYEKFVEIRKKAEREKRYLTTEEIEERARIEGEINELVDQHLDLDKENNLKRTLYGKGEGRQIPGGDPQDQGQGYYPSEHRVRVERKKDYRSMFHNGDKTKSLDCGGFKNASEFLDVVGSGRFDSRLVRSSMVEGTPSLGGFSVPDEFAADWLDNSLPEEIVRSRCQVWPMKSASRTVPGWDSSNQTDGSLFGGFAMEFLAEEATGTKQTGKLRKIRLEAKKGAIYCDISSELEQDGLGFEGQLRNALIKSIGYGIDKHCLTGTGAGQPQGIFNSSALVTIPKETGQAADSIVYENLTKMYARQLNKKEAVWLFNDDAVPQLMKITIAVGTGGSHVKLMNEQDGKFTIFGRPVIFTPHMPTLGDANDCGFVNFGAYLLGIRKEMLIDKSIAPGWTEDLVSYRIIIRFDGQGVLDKAITPEKGATLSPFVTLAAR